MAIRDSLQNHGLSYWTSSNPAQTFVDYGMHVNGRDVDACCVIEVEYGIDNIVKLNLTCRGILSGRVTPRILEWMNDVTLNTWFVTCGARQLQNGADELLFDAAITLTNNQLAEGVYQIMSVLVMDVERQLSTLPDLI